MTFPRFHLFEFEDQPWFPGIVRDLATDYLCFIQSALGLHRSIVPVLAAAGLSTHVTLTDRDACLTMCEVKNSPERPTPAT